MFMETRKYSITFGLLTLYLIIYGLITAKGLLIPMVIAVFLWHLLNTSAIFIKTKIPFAKSLPYGLCLLIAIFILVYCLYKLGEIITNNVNDVIKMAPKYQENLLMILNNFGSKFRLKVMGITNEFFQQLSFRSLFIGVSGVFTTITSNAFLIILYVSFLFLEQQVMWRKLEAFMKNKRNLKVATSIISQIVSDMRVYIGVKTSLSIVTALTSWLIMKSVNLDFAEFWALLIFCMNYIPNIGSIISTFFPSLIALIQFNETLAPFVIVAGGITVTQFIVGNVIDPKYLGRSLNLSPLIILLSLAVWGSVWGIIGLFLSIPMTVMMMIVFSHFESTKGIAILLSANGLLRNHSE